MSDSAQGNALLARLASPGLVLLLAVLFAGRPTAPSYVPPRPAKVDESAPAHGSGSMEALLTQDPLDVARLVESERRLASPTHGFVLNLDWSAASSGRLAPESAAELAQDLERMEREQEPVLLVCELLRSGDGVEDRERRVRNRQATLYALLEERYRPAEHHTLHYFCLGEHVVPYEWFERKGPSSKTERVLLLWIDEAKDDGKPITNLVKVLDAVTAGSAKPLTKVIGPTSSGEMLELLEDDAWGEGTDLAPIEILSPAATARSRFGERLKQREKETTRFSIRWTIGDDVDLARLLVAELFERIPTLMPKRKDPNAHPWMELIRMLPKGFGPRGRARDVRVAVLTEANTTYGDQWLCNLDEVKHELVGGHLIPEKTVQFVPFPFVSPIDGDMGATALGAAGKLDPDYPIGAKQVDYLRRVGDQLDSSAADSEVPYDAIGIFATDVYDTLLILQALRPRFPHALFFTTDLDARFLHRDHRPYTRNLIVASHCGLSVERATDPASKESSGIDRRAVSAARFEFRDTYQTTLFRAMSLALGSQCDSIARNTTPRLTEIGLTSAVELNTPRLARTDTTQDYEPRRSRLVQVANRIVASTLPWFDREAHAQESSTGTKSVPGRKSTIDEHPWGTVFSVVSAILLTFLVGLFAYVPRLPREGVRWQLVGLAFVLWGALVIWTLERASHLEPFAQEPLVFDQGVSIWPTVILRLALLVYCLLAIAQVQSVLVSGSAALRLAHKLYGTERPALGSWQACVWVLGGAQAERHSMEAVWKRVERFVASPWVWLRIFAYAWCIYFLAAPFYVLSIPPTVPLRGEFAYVVERWTLVTSLWAFFMLFAYVVETTFLTVRLIVRITHRESTVLPMLLLRSHRRASLRTSPSKSPGRFGSTLDQKLRLDLVRDLTRTVENLVYFPMAAVCLQILARASLIDAWSWPTVLTATLVIFFALLLTCLVVLRRVVRRVQDGALHHVEEQRLLHVNDEAEKKRLDLVREHLQALRGGAFSPLFEHPLVHSALLVVTTIVAVQKDLVSAFFSWL